jgi:hypothetical protein
MAVSPLLKAYSTSFTVIKFLTFSPLLRFHDAPLIGYACIAACFTVLPVAVRSEVPEQDDSL